MHTRSKFLLPFLLVGPGAPLVASCVTTTPTTGTNQSALGCSEFNPNTGLDADVKVDARVRAFVQSSVDLGGVAATLKSAVRTACTGIATDLGAADTWTAMGDSDDAVSNANKTGACDAARQRIVAIMTAHRDANFALVISRGECHTNFNDEAKCESGCSSQANVRPRNHRNTLRPRPTQRRMPGHLLEPSNLRRPGRCRGEL